MSDKSLSIILGGAVFGIVATLLAVPQVQVLGCLACLSYVGAGMLAVWHYTRTHGDKIEGEKMSGGEGAGMGALSGVVAGLVGTVLGLAFRAIGLLPSAEEVMEQMEMSGQLDQVDANTADMIYKWVEFSTGIGGVLIGLVVAVILGVIGGAIGASVFKKSGSAASEVPPTV